MMPRKRRHHEHHVTARIGWLRAAVLGANDGIVSTACLIVGVAAAHGGKSAVLAAGVASLVAGGMSMAAGEYVSVSSQRDLEEAETEVEREELKNDRPGEHKELANIYVNRGLTPDLAHEVAEQLMEHDALDAHMRDELGIYETHKARPLQASVASGLSYVSGALLPLLIVVPVPQDWMIAAVCALALIILTILGGVAARAGGASIRAGALRVLIWGAISLAVTAGVGRLFGAVL
jgi:VIT1/CCC1 family predicted Fe2+/Mn2+ transporter